MPPSRLSAEDLKRLFREVSNVQRFVRKYEAQFELLDESAVTVLKMTAEGFSNRDMATQLKLSLPDIDAYHHQIKRCLPIRTQLDYVKFALAFGLVAF
jgi:DNA-binding NarL/FixJ family response regulator